MNEDLWWLSFADDSGSRGVCVVGAPTLDAAIKKAWRLGINPGGQVCGACLSEAIDIKEARDEIARVGTNRLVTPDELRALGYLPMKEMDDQDLATRAADQLEESGRIREQP